MSTVGKAPNRSHRVKSTKPEPKNTLEGFNSRADEAEERMSELKDRVEELNPE